MRYAELKKTNLKVFGISKVKTLNDFVTTEQDVKNGNNRLPLNLARLHEENVIKEETGGLSSAIENLKFVEGDEDELTKNIQHKRDALARSSSYIPLDEDDFSQSRDRSVSLYSREKEAS